MRILAWHKTSEESWRLGAGRRARDGHGPRRRVGDGRQFRSARRFAAWLGLTVRVQASGGKERIGRTSEDAERYLRRLLIHGGRAVVGTTFRNNVAPMPWLAAWVGRRPVNVAATAAAQESAWAGHDGAFCG
jgi:transposase